VLVVSRVLTLDLHHNTLQLLLHRRDVEQVQDDLLAGAERVAAGHEAAQTRKREQGSVGA